MASAPVNGLGPNAPDPEAIGWWIESADEDLYGPASRKTLRRFLEEGVISPNTLVRHCTHTEARPVADQPGMTDGLTLGAAPASGDRLADDWPRRRRDRLALAEDSCPCWRHKRPAVGVCVRCHGPYCERCRVRARKPFFFCRPCQTNHHNRRFLALMVDGILFNYLPLIASVPVAAQAEAAGYVIQLGGLLVFLVRDAVFGGAGPGKRLWGLRVVRSQDGMPPGYGQGIVRWLSQFIPIFNLVDAFAPLGDPLQRRYGDRWAKTRVIDAEARLAKVRRRVRDWLARKGVTLAREPGLPMSQYARLA
jgi:uncharacterized RDD family membrane protein YckC